MRKLRAIRIMNGYQASVNIVVDKSFDCPDDVIRTVRQISDTATGKYSILCEDEDGNQITLIVKAVNVIEQVK